MHPITALQSEYSLWTRDPEAEVLPVLRELGIGFVPYSPARATASSPAQIRSTDDFADDDWRKTNPRFTGENFQRNLRIADEVEAIAAEVGATPAQVALAWLLAQGDDIAPIPGTKRVARVEENIAADGVELTAEQIERLNNLTPAAGEHHNEAGMRTPRALTPGREATTRSRAGSNAPSASDAAPSAERGRMPDSSARGCRSGKVLPG